MEVFSLTLQHPVGSFSNKHYYVEKKNSPPLGDVENSHLDSQFLEHQGQPLLLLLLSLLAVCLAGVAAQSDSWHQRDLLPPAKSTILEGSDLPVW